MKIGYKAFTLIEILITIVIIGILIVSLIPRIEGIQNKARYAKVEKDTNDLKAAIVLAQNNTNKSLSEITNSVCSVCACGGLGTNIRNQGGSGSVCRTNRFSVLRKIEQAAGLDAGSLRGLELDPWGNPYLFNENEGEYNNGNCALYADNIWSAGPNSIVDLWFEYTGDRVKISDDIGYSIRPYSCSTSY